MDYHECCFTMVPECDNGIGIYRKVSDGVNENNGNKLTNCETAEMQSIRETGKKAIKPAEKETKKTAEKETEKPATKTQ